MTILNAIFWFSGAGAITAGIYISFGLGPALFIAGVCLVISQVVVH